MPRWFICLVMISLASCTSQPENVVIISDSQLAARITIVPNNSVTSSIPQTPVPTSSVLEVISSPALSPASTATDQPQAMQEHIVQAGETLSMIAQKYQVSLDSLVRLNNLTNPDLLSIGQVIRLPKMMSEISPALALIPDRALVRTIDSLNFDVEAFVQNQTLYLRSVTDTVTTRLANGAGFDEQLSSVQVIQRIVSEYSVDSRLLLAMLEYRAGWLSQAEVEATDYPLISAENSLGVNRQGLYRQLAWLANELNRGYYGFKTRNLRILEFSSGERLQLNMNLNPASIALQYFLSLNTSYTQWQRDISEEGFIRTYKMWFGDPFVTLSQAPIIPDNLEQPRLTLPFQSGEIWYFTGGAHGGWGSGSAWASIDFAPPDERTDGSVLCYTSAYSVLAVADGTVVLSEAGRLILDLDEDANPLTGWTIHYLHLAEQDRVPIGTRVTTGDFIGRAACAGGFSTATHLHIGRQYNGEWIAADCQSCLPEFATPAFILSDWRVIGIDGQEYQGYLEKAGIRVIAEQGRTAIVNQISW